MANYPQPLKNREELNLRLGIKSSLPHFRAVVASVYMLFIANDKKSELVYSEEYQDSGVYKLRLPEMLVDKLVEKFGDELSKKIESSPLFTSQIEPLQVGLELFVHLAKINYTRSGLSERTGLNRYQKEIHFTTNVLLLDLYLNSYPIEEVKTLLLAWLNDVSLPSELDDGLKIMLAIFSEDVLYKIRTAPNEKELFFQREGIYEELKNEGGVNNDDAKELVGPYRIFKAYVGAGMHPFLQDKNHLFTLKGDKSAFLNYSQIVSNTLDVYPRKKSPIYDNLFSQNSTNSSFPLQQIFYGAPGTGKSHEVKIITGELDNAGIEHERPNVFRTTFHPDTDYATFVGCYKPTMKPVEEKYRAVAGKEEEIAYEFVPQAFTDAYVYAYNHPTEPTYLVIEEINRGNCAQIFGDLFQLLDRKADGTSEYAIKADKDFAKYLLEAKTEEGEEILIHKEGIQDGKLRLPRNLNILATMNTSDQSLFPMDSAFKRRWDWRYVAISYTEPNSAAFTINVGKGYQWVDFIRQVNKRIFDLTQSEDKELGNFFIKSSIDAEQFKSKVMFYLWYEVLRDEVENSKYFFYYIQKEEGTDKEIAQKFTFKDLYGDHADVILNGFLQYISKDAE